MEVISTKSLPNDHILKRHRGNAFIEPIGPEYAKVMDEFVRACHEGNFVLDYMKNSSSSKSRRVLCLLLSLWMALRLGLNNLRGNNEAYVMEL